MSRDGGGHLAQLHIYPHHFRNACRGSQGASRDPVLLPRLETIPLCRWQMDILPPGPRTHAVRIPLDRSEPGTLSEEYPLAPVLVRGLRARRCSRTRYRLGGREDGAGLGRNSGGLVSDGRTGAAFQGSRCRHHEGRQRASEGASAGHRQTERHSRHHPRSSRSS